MTITHVPTGISVYNCETRSQFENKERALQELKRRLEQEQNRTAAKEQNTQRRMQVINERSAKTFTWNEQRGTVTDHTTGTSWRIKDFMKGKM